MNAQYRNEIEKALCMTVNTVLIILSTAAAVLINSFIFDRIFQKIVFTGKLAAANRLLSKIHDYDDIMFAAVIGAAFILFIVLVILFNRERKEEIFKSLSAVFLICGAFLMLLQYSSVNNYTVFLTAASELTAGAVILLIYCIKEKNKYSVE